MTDAIYLSLVNITRAKTTTPKVKAMLDAAGLNGKYIIHDKHRHDGETMIVLLFKDKATAALAKMFDVPGEPSPIDEAYLDSLNQKGVISWGEQ